MTDHGDDFASSGLKLEMRWLEFELKREFEIKIEILGPDPKRHLQEVRVLNRV